MKFDILETRYTGANESFYSARMIKVGSVEGKTEEQCIANALAMGFKAPILGTPGEADAYVPPAADRRPARPARAERFAR